MKPETHFPYKQSFQQLNINFKDSIRFKLMTTVIIITSVFVALFLYLNYVNEIKRLNQQVNNNFSLLADILKNDTNRWLTYRENDVASMAANPLIQQYLSDIMSGSAGSSRARTELLRYWMEVKAQYGVYDEIYFVSKDGEIMVSTNPEREHILRPQDAIINKPLTTGSIYFQDAYMSYYNNKPSIAYSTPVRNLSQNHPKNAGYAGVLVCRIDIQTVLQPMLESQVNLGKTGEVILINENNTAITELRNRPGSALNYNLKSEPALKVTQGEEGLLKGLGYNGQEIVSVYRYLPQTGWGIIIRQETSEIYGPVKYNALRFTITGLSALLLMLLIMYITFSRFLKPVKEMADVARDISRGNLSRRTQIQSRDEIGVLGQTLNSMADDLEQQFKVQKTRQDVLVALSSNLNMCDILNRGLNIICRSYSYNVGAIFLVDDQKKTLLCKAMYCPGQKLNRKEAIKMGEGLEGFAALTQGVQLVTGITEDTVYTVNWLGGSLQPAAIVAIPVAFGSETLGVISLASVNGIDQRDINELTDIGNLFGVAVNNNLSHEETQRLSHNLQELNEQLAQQNEELNAQSEELLSQTEELQAQSEELLGVTDELQKKNHELERVGEQKSRFVATLSHELRAPLNAVISFSDVLLDKVMGELNQQQEKYLREILNSGQHLLNLINDLLDHSKIEAGQLELKIEEVDPSAPLEEAITMVSADISRNRLVITNSIKPHSYLVAADRDRLKQVFLNLLTNAVKFTPKSGQITIGARVNNLVVEFWVADTGIGIDKKDQDIIFEEFKQGENASGTIGTGLGLAITKKLLELQGGKIFVSSAKEQGATFTFTLPLVDVGLAGLTGQREASHAESQIKSKSIGTPIMFLQKPVDKAVLLEHLERIQHQHAGAPLTVMVIDDDPVIRGYLAAVLAPRGYKFLEASNGLKGIEKACDQKPDIIILDIIMPGANGFEVMDKLAEESWVRDLHIFILTSKNLTQEERNYLESRF